MHPAGPVVVSHDRVAVLVQGKRDAVTALSGNGLGLPRTPGSSGYLRRPVVSVGHDGIAFRGDLEDRKSTRLNSSHVKISYAVFCLKKKKKKFTQPYNIKKNKNNKT